MPAKKTYTKKKRVYKKKSNKATIASLSNQLRQMSVFRGEKKKISDDSNDSGGVIIGQCYGDSDGNLFKDMTPAPASGDGSSNREGEQIRLYSSVLKLSFAQQDSTSAARRVKITIMEVLGTPQGVGTVEGQYLVTNPLSGVRDYYSMPNTAYRAQYKVLATRHLTVPADNIGGQRLFKDIQINLKYNKGWGHLIRYAGVSTSVGQLVMVVQCDLGNCHPSSASTLPVYVNAVNTGLDAKYNIQHYYYDN